MLPFFLAATVSHAQTFTDIFDFNCTNGCEPRYVSLVQGTDGNLYGTTVGGGTKNRGTAFKVTPNGTLITIYSFCAKTNSCADGANPEGGLALGTDEDFYGTAYDGGGPSCRNGCGTIFKMTSRGALTTLHSFDLTDGAHPIGALIQAADGNFYGTTYEGASHHCFGGCGTIFRLTPQGRLTTLHTFGGIDGANPRAALVQGTDGNLYGTTSNGGMNLDGTVFKITLGGTLTTLHNFDGADGILPEAALVQASDGNFYGTTDSGGTFEDGTVFKITPEGTLTVLHNFTSGDGSDPVAPLLQATDGNLYGTTELGGANCTTGFGVGCGTVFEITLEGALTSLHSFNETDGYEVQGGLVQATNGVLYGTTSFGGLNQDGTIFSEDVGLEPFITTLPTSRAVGQRVAILGNNLTGTTSVTFNGTPATFAVLSSTEISTTVPAGATTGPVQAATPSGTLTSNESFRVRQ
ncbi:MAG TPA: choice-of-anchor tandem repeat GloVer-containing protein [Terriglobales bacterium]